MVIITDANIILSGIINPYSLIASILIEGNAAVEFVTPEFALEEIRKHKEKICTKSNVSPPIFDLLLDKFLSRITVYGSNVVTAEIFNSAKVLTKLIDTNDTWYVAYAMAFNGILWTGDLKLHKGLRRQAFYQVITTQEFSAILKGF